MPSKLLITAADYAHHIDASGFFGVRTRGTIEGPKTLERLHQEQTDRFVAHNLSYAARIPAHHTIEGQARSIQPGHTSTIRRIECGMLPYRADMDINTNSYELGMDRLVKPDTKADFIGNSAFKRIREEGVSRKRVGLVIDGPALTGSYSRLRALKKDGEQAGKVTSAVFSPRVELNIALAMVGADFATVGTHFDVETSSGR
jgi:glycine cleavage system aminomethyltransferase T